MEGANRLYEITQQVRGDRLGNALMDEVLTECFDLALGDSSALERLMGALERFNGHLAVYPAPAGAGLFHGSETEVSQWAENLTFEILTTGVV